MKELFINILGAFLLVYMVLALSIFVIATTVVMGLFILIESLINFVSGIIKGNGIVLR
jgi:hypothetical protein